MISESCRLQVALEVASLGECGQTDGAMPQCKNYQWRCDDGTCIELTEQCDGVPNCLRGEDEKFCSNEVDFGEENGKSLLVKYRLDLLLL